MINLYFLDQDNKIKHTIHDPNLPFDEDPVWIDLYNITPSEEKMVESHLGIDVPTKQEMVARAVSKRLYTENGATYTTAMMIAKSDERLPHSEPITFIIYNNCLITVRYSQPLTFTKFAEHILENTFEVIPTSQSLYVGLMDAAVDRLTAILEKARTNIDKTANSIFQLQNKKEKVSINYRSILTQIGSTGRLVAKAMESSVSMQRIMTFATQSASVKWQDSHIDRINVLLKDLDALGDYADFLSNETSFLLDATLGVINIEQNDVMKIFSIVSIIFMPPTLVASIYGMNFRLMPEIDWEAGYFYAIGLMLFSAVLSYRFFKKQKLL
jgi:magnesium transporter